MDKQLGIQAVAVFVGLSLSLVAAGPPVPGPGDVLFDTRSDIKNGWEVSGGCQYAVDEAEYADFCSVSSDPDNGTGYWSPCQKPEKLCRFNYTIPNGENGAPLERVSSIEIRARYEEECCTRYGLLKLDYKNAQDSTYTTMDFYGGNSWRIIKSPNFLDLRAGGEIVVTLLNISPATNIYLDYIFFREGEA